MKALAGLRGIAAASPLRLRLSGDCMEPSLPADALVDVVPARFYWPGDVLVFEGSDGRLTAHRVLGPRPGREMRYYTRGDRSPVVDSAVPASAIVGRVQRRTPLTERLQAMSRLAIHLAARFRARLA